MNTTHQTLWTQRQLNQRMRLVEGIRKESWKGAVRSALKCSALNACVSFLVSNDVNVQILKDYILWLRTSPAIPTQCIVSYDPFSIENSIKKRGNHYINFLYILYKANGRSTNQSAWICTNSLNGSLVAIV